MRLRTFCIAHKLNLIVAGGTSTGKTVLARKLISFVPEHERIITIEEAAELIPTQPNTVTLLSDRDNPPTLHRCAAHIRAAHAP